MFGTIGMPGYSGLGQRLNLEHGFSCPKSLTHGKRHQLNVTKPAIEIRKFSPSKLATPKITK
jgi:hypothetical protein